MIAEFWYSAKVLGADTSEYKQGLVMGYVNLGYSKLDDDVSQLASGS